jgi:hypothetical protein
MIHYIPGDFIVLYFDNGLEVDSIVVETHNGNIIKVKAVEPNDHLLKLGWYEEGEEHILYRPQICLS